MALAAAITEQQATSSDIAISVQRAAEAAADIAQRASAVAAGSRGAVGAVDQAEDYLQRLETTVGELRRSVGAGATRQRELVEA